MDNVLNVFDFTSISWRRRVLVVGVYIIMSNIHLMKLITTLSSTRFHSILVSKPCSESHVCLTWKIQNSSLVLICRVDTKNNFPITFYDPFHNETGFCVHVKCQSLLPNAVIKTIDTTNTVITLQEIVFTIPLKVQLNGWWTCTHGHNNSEAVTEVTIQDIHLNTNSGK